MRKLTILFALVTFGCSANSTSGAQLTDSGTAADSQTSTTGTDASRLGTDTDDPLDTYSPDGVTDLDVGVPDSTTPDTTKPDTITPDTITPDTITPDTITPDASAPDTSTPDEDLWVAIGPDLIDGVSEDLTAVYVTNDASAVWAVGDKGRVISNSGGTGNWLSWQTRSKANLRGVGADADGEVFVVGTGGYIGRRIEGGFATENSGTTENLNAVWFTSEGVSHQGFAVGEAGTLLSSSTLGDWWKMVAFTEDGELVSQLNDVHGDGMANGGNVFAVGDDTIIMKFNGKHWAQEAAEVDTFESEDFIAVTSHDGIFWAAGSGGLFVRRNDSAYWEQQAVVPPSQSPVVDLTTFDGAPVAVALHAVMELGATTWGVTNASLTSPSAASSDNTGIWVVGAKGLVTHLEPLNSL